MEGRVIENYELHEIVGVGAFATVFRATHRPTNLPVACKVVPKSCVTDDSSFALLQREVSVMKTLDHPFIVPIFEVFEDAANFYIATELLERGTLSDRISQSGGMSQRDCRRVFCHLVVALEYLHLVRRTVHRDLKPENILFDRNGFIRLIDFGFSRCFTTVDPLLGSICGSPAYMAPEIIRGCPYTSCADVWSLGVVLFVMLTGYFPFGSAADGAAEMLRTILSTEAQIPSELPADCRDMLQRLLTKEPKNRVALADLRLHPWVSQCESARFFRPEFRQLSVFKIHTPVALDPIIGADLGALGYDLNGLGDELRSGVMNERTAAYKVLKRDKLIDDVTLWNPRRRSLESADCPLVMTRSDGVAKILRRPLPIRAKHPKSAASDPAPPSVLRQCHARIAGMCSSRLPPIPQTGKCNR
jgi:serine/threonine protein kinase